MVVVGLVACAPANPPSPAYEYTDEYLRLSEPYSGKWVVNGNLQKTEVDSRTYLFDPSISVDTRSDFISAQEALCLFLSEKGISTDGLRFIVPKDYINRSDSTEKTAYFALDTQGTYQQILVTLQTALGDYVNYGYAYALADHTAATLGWITDAPAEEVNAKKFQSSPALLQLVYPCFSEDYTPRDEIDACRHLSRACLAGMDDPYAGEDTFMTAVQDFAREAGIDFTPTHLGFAYAGVDCPLKIRTKYVELFRNYSYERSSDRLDVEDDILAWYDTSISFFEEFDRRAEELRTLFETEDDFVIPVMLAGNIGVRYAGLFYPKGEDSKIELSDLYALMHEYIHYLDYTRHLTNGGNTTNWSNWTHEVLTTYYSRYYDVLFRLKLAEAGETIHPSRVIGQPYEDEDDELLFRRIYLATTPQKNELLYRLKTAYDYGAVSFGGYFAELYGDAALIECMMYPEKTPDLTGKALDEIVNDWCEWIAATEIPEGSVVN